MEPLSIRFGGGATGTMLSLPTAVVMVVTIILLLGLPRRYAIAPLLIAILMVPTGQALVIAGVHFTVTRILILIGLGRWVISRRGRPRAIFAGGFNSIDRVFSLFAFMQLVAFSVEWMAAQAIIKGLGNFLDTLGGYILLRSLIRDEEDIRRTIKVFAIVAVVMGACMINEQVTQHNIFDLFGGQGLPAVRDGKIRSQGAFEVFITAGSFGATLLPLLVWLWSAAKSKIIAYLGMAGATAMTVTSNSSTPDLVYVAGILALCFWPFRRRLRVFRRGLVVSLIGLHLIMKAPVWALIARIDLTGSSSGDHRFRLVDNFIRHFGEWWIVGFKDYNNWGWDMWDLSNQFVAYGLTGGLITLTLFIALLSQSFAGLGRARKLVAQNRSEAWLFWCLGAGLFAHVVAFWGVSYFDQMQFAFCSLLAIISVSVSRVTRPSGRTASQWEFWRREPTTRPVSELHAPRVHLPICASWLNAPLSSATLVPACLALENLQLETKPTCGETWLGFGLSQQRTK